MEKLKLDTGVQAFRINGGGILRFNPADPNLYARFFEALDKLRDLEFELTGQVRAMEHDDGAGVLRLMSQADAKMKALLTQVFGGGNDFDQLLDGVNLMAVAANGERVLTNLIDALMPVFEAGLRRCALEGK